MRTVRVLFGVVMLCMAGGVLTTPVDTVTPALQDVPAAEVPATLPPANATASTETSKMSRFLDDFTSAFKQGTAKMKESLESAATSVKDGVLQGYDYVRSKLTGTGETAATPVSTPSTGEESANSTTTVPVVAPLTSAAPPSTESRTPAISPNKQQESLDSALSALGGMVGVSNEPAHIVPNDDDDDDGSRIIFNDKDYVTETPVTTTVTVDNRFIIAGPLACKSGQEVVNGKCRNVF